MRTWFEQGCPGCLVVAEVAQNHDGSLGAAHAYIDAVAAAGAHAVKFQTHIAAAESTPQEPWRVRFSRQDETRYDYWKRMEFSEAQWAGLAAHAQERGLEFLSSPFSPEAVELLERVGAPAWKVGAGEVTNLPMLELMAATGKPVILSSGMSPWSDLDAATELLRRRGTPFAVLQCTTAYPCPPERLGLNVMQEIRERYGCPTGLSDHSGTIYAGLAAAALGASLVEVHVTFSRDCFGPDVPASITTSELTSLVEGVRFIEQALAHPVDKGAMAEELSEMRQVFGKSVVARRDLPAGHRLEAGDLACRKPGTGIPAARLAEVSGRRLARPVSANTLLREDDLA
ncbi:MAG: N-acetylneuraminate synthase family protein [Bryobacteraceae bacterium]|nr:N-acetylneuraminate synthase family protein [Bryobacteraceae bacterium]